MNTSIGTVGKIEIPVGSILRAAFLRLEAYTDPAIDEIAGKQQNGY